MSRSKEYIQNALEKNPFAPLWQVIYSYLKREIITLRLAPGDKLMESRIALAMDVSRSPVKRALEQLTMEGLVEEDETGKPRVSPITKQDLQHLACARLEIDGQSAKVAAKRITPADLAEMERLLNQFKVYTDDFSFYRFAVLDDQFHGIIYKACGNPYLQSMYAVIRPGLLRYRYYSMAVYPNKEELFKSTYICHGAIYYAMKHHLSEVARTEVQQDAARMPDTIALIPNTMNYDIFKELDNSEISL